MYPCVVINVVMLCIFLGLACMICAPLTCDLSSLSSCKVEMMLAATSWKQGRSEDFPVACIYLYHYNSAWKPYDYAFKELQRVK